MRTFLAVTIGCAGLLFPSVAVAQQPPNAPPGNSAVDEYFETIPDADGNRSTGRPARDPASVLGAKTARELAKRGREGQALSDFAAKTAPKDATKRPPGGLRAGDDLDGRGDSAVKATVSALTDGSSDGLGWLLPLLLAASAVAAAGVIVVRHRSS